MSEMFLVAGIALCVLSILAAIVSVLQMQAPRGAAILFFLGIVAMVAGAWLNPEPFVVQDFAQAWARVIGR